MVCVPGPAVAGLNIPEEEVPGPDQIPPWLVAVSWKGGAVRQNGPAGLIVAFGAPVWALPGVDPSCKVKLLELPLQFSTMIISVCPAVTAGAGTEEEQGNELPNWLHPLEELA